MNYTVVNGDNIEVLKSYPDNYFDAVVTDPPYGLGKEPNAVELMKDWVDKGYHEISGKGFMGKEWDAFVPQPIFWKEVFRVLKHGGHVLAFYGTRTYDWGVMSMRFAGFEVRDCIQWLYGCLSDDTEILTRGGYIQYHNFIKLPNFEQQEILIYDIENDIYKWEKPERWNDYNIHQDICYRIKSDSTDQIVSRNHHCLVEREGKLVFIQAEMLSELEYMPTLSDDLSFIQKGYSEVLHKKMQWTLSGSILEETRTQGKGIMVGRNEREISEITNRRKEPIVERGNNLSKKERVLCGSQTEICEMPEGVYSDGKERWVCSGVSADYGNSDRQTFIENGVRTSHRPQSNEQRHNELDVICNEQGTQAIRMGRSYSTTLATITPIEYSGVIFCPTVSTGCFVARRNGKIFITGNSGFPKSHNISKALDKMEGAEREVIGKKERGSVEEAKERGVGFLSDHANRNNTKQFGYGTELITAPATDAAKQWDGWGTALKPANEPIVLARKPLEKGLSVAENILKWGVGGINIDASRIGLSKGDDSRLGGNGSWKTDKAAENIYEGGYEGKDIASSPLGRFPANIILTHHPDCECKGTKKVKGSNCSPDDIGKGRDGDYSNGIYGEKSSKITASHTDENGEETIEDWQCQEDCPIRILDEQSGVSKSQRSERGNIIDNNVYGKYKEQENTLRGHSDKGGASRFFYVAKASKSERNKGLDGFEEKENKHSTYGIHSEEGLINNGRNPENRTRAMSNFHPTVKPIKLMQYLVKLVTPSNGIVLDPFCGSGTTGVACKLDGFHFVGIEQDPEYTKIAEARINNYGTKGEQIKESEPKSDKTELIQSTLF